MGFGVMNMDSFGEDEKMHPNPLKQGDFFSYNACTIDYTPCDNFFKYHVWISNELDDSWELEVIGIDGKKIKQFSNVIDKNSSIIDNLKNSDLVNSYSLFKTDERNTEPTITKIPQTISLEIGDFESILHTWNDSGIVHKIWFVDEIQVPIKVHVLSELPTLSNNALLKMELTNYGNSNNFKKDFLSPFQQLRMDTHPDKIECKENLALVFKLEDHSPTCIQIKNHEKLVKRGWADPIRPLTIDKDVSADEIECITEYTSDYSDKFDSRFLDKIFALLDTGETRAYSVAIYVAEENKEIVKNMLKNCHDPADILKNKKSSPIIAEIPLYEIPMLANYDFITKITPTESFVLPFILEEVEGKIWVGRVLTQCLTNPWESDWLTNNDDDHSTYVSLDSDEVLKVIKNYYGKKGIVIFDAKTDMTHYRSICEGCGCSAGAQYVLVSDNSLELSLAQGFHVYKIDAVIPKNFYMD